MPPSIEHSRIKHEHVLAALQEIDTAGAPSFGDAKKYKLEHQGRSYAPKAVVGVAYRLATGTQIGPDDFRAGNGPGQANRILRDLGFHVHEFRDPLPRPRWWVIAAGEGGEAWNLFQETNCIAHHGGHLGDLREYVSEADMERAIQAISQSDKRPKNDAKANWQTVHEMEIGDYVVAKIGLDRIVGIGMVRSKYKFVAPVWEDYSHQREVSWLWKGNTQLESDTTFAIMTLTDATLRQDVIGQAERLLASTGHEVAPEPTPFHVGERYTREDVQRLLGLEPVHGGNWFTGYTKHMRQWYLFPNVGVAGRTGHDYPNRWDGERLRWYGKTGTTASTPSMKDMLADHAIVNLFTRSADRDPFTYHGRVKRLGPAVGTPVEVLWEVIPQAVSAPLAEEVATPERYREGATTRIVIDARERSREARAACIRHWGTNCFVCGLSMEHMYGPTLQGFIHVHHLRSLAERDEEYEVDHVEDLRPVCPNCHAVIHTQRQPHLTIEQVKAMIEEARRNRGQGTT